MSTQRVAPSGVPLRGTFRVPGDKSISHRALFFTTLRPGILLRNLAPGEDLVRSRRMIEAAGYVVEHVEGGVRVHAAPERPDALEDPVRIDCGNSGTTARLGLGWLTGERGLWKVTGDESLRRRPMGRIIDPLERLGARFRGGRSALPVSVIAEGILQGGGSTDIFIDVSSAQVHAGLLLAGLRSRRGVRLARVAPMRDHTLRIAQHLRLPVDTDGDVDDVHPLMVSEPEGATTDRYGPTVIDIPGDISSASFLVAAALLQPGSDITISGVGLNPTRIGFLEAVRSMGGDVWWGGVDDPWEPVGEIRVRGGGELVGRSFSPETVDIAGMADEIPLLVLLAAHAEGGSVIAGAGELRVKESDRISATVSMLTRLGLDVRECPDGFETPGGGRVQGGVDVDPAGDHRLAMLAGIAGLVAERPVTVHNPEVASVSWPGFWDEIGRMGE